MEAGATGTNTIDNSILTNIVSFVQTISVGDSAHQLVRLGAFGSFLLREADDTLTAVDTGLPGSAPGILAAARQIGAPVGRIVLTHAHQDHVGSLDALVAALGGVDYVQVAIGRREARLLAGDFSLDAAEPQTKMRGGFGRCATRPTVLLEDGQQVPGSELRAVACSGHTPGHLGFLDERDGTLFCGDALVNVGGLSVSGVWRTVFPFPYFATWHRPSACASARHLLALAPTTLACCHGRPIPAPAEALERAIAEAEGASAVVHAATSDHAGLPHVR